MRIQLSSYVVELFGEHGIQVLDKETNRGYAFSWDQVIGALVQQGFIKK